LRPDFAWLDCRALDRLGYPAQRRGVSRNLPRLGFVGLPYQYTFRSGFLAGMADDAGYVTRQLA
jgi:putative flavoprotein involved in K+ transport